MLEILEEARREAPASSTSSSRRGTSSSPTARRAAGRSRSIPRRPTCSRTRPGRPAPEGRRPRPGRLPRLDRARGLLPGRRGARRRVHFATDMGWIMGPWTVVGGGAMGATLVFAEGAPDWPPDRLWRLSRQERVTIARLLADARARADPARRAGSGPLVAAHVRHDRRAVEPRAVPLAVRTGRRRRASRSSTAPAARRSAPVFLSPVDREPDQGVLARRARARDGDGRRRLGRAVARRHRRGRRARLPQAVPRDDARVLATTRSGTSTRTGGASPASGRTATGPRSTGRLLVPARPLRRHAEHRRQADRARRARVGRGRAPGRARGGRGRRPARGEGRGRVVFCVPAARESEASAAEVAGLVAPSSARRSSRTRRLRRRRCRRRAGRRSSAARSGDRARHRSRATSRRSRTPRPSTRSRAALARYRFSTERRKLTMRLALAQINTVVGDLDGNRALILARLDEARAAGADLVLFPELAVTGLPARGPAAAPGLRARRPGGRSTRSRPRRAGSPRSSASRRFDGDLVQRLRRLRRRRGARRSTASSFLPNYGVFDEHRYFAAGRRPRAAPARRGRSSA